MVLKVMKIVDERLKTNTFLVGDRLTIADVTVFFSWNEVSGTLEKEGKQLSSLLRWAKQLSSIPYK
jgi:glutathione S-transferase